MMQPESLDNLVLFHQVLDSAPGQAMRRFMGAVAAGSGLESAYLSLVRALYAEPRTRLLTGDAWQNHLMSGILQAETALTGQQNRHLLEAAAHDLRILQQLFALTGDGCGRLADGAALPTWPGWSLTPTEDPALAAARAFAAELGAAGDWGALAGRLAEHYRTAGSGLPGAYWYLRWEGGALQGIDQPHVFRLEDLIGVEEAKATVLKNTEQFVQGRPANNLLLYGSRGTGKSSMVRALVPRFGARGLRMVEVPRSHVSSLPEIFRALRRYSQRFVLFLDDLSFDEAETDYKAFKSNMEGALEERPANVVLYATSNRRHLVPERWTDRHTPDTAEVHSQDAMEEKLSLADRFGVTVLFTSPAQEEYLAIVEHMAAQRGIHMDRDRLRELALRWVLWNNPRSGRSARHFIDDLAGQR